MKLKAKLKSTFSYLYVGILLYFPWIALAITRGNTEILSLLGIVALVTAAYFIAGKLFSNLKPKNNG